jgi:hypothetical protein
VFVKCVSISFSKANNPFSIISPALGGIHDELRYNEGIYSPFVFISVMFIVCFAIRMLRVSLAKVSVNSGFGVGLWMQNFKPRPRRSLAPAGSSVSSKLWKARFFGWLLNKRLVSIEVSASILFCHIGFIGSAWKPYVFQNSCSMYFVATSSLLANSFLYVFDFLSLFLFQYLLIALWPFLRDGIAVSTDGGGCIPFRGLLGLVSFVVLSPVLSLILLRFVRVPSPPGHGLFPVDVPVPRVELGIVWGLGSEVSCTVLVIVVVRVVCVSCIVIMASRLSLFVVDDSVGLGCIDFVVCLRRLEGNQLGKASLYVFVVVATFFFAISFGLC